MELVLLASRNLARNRRRTLLSLLVVAFGTVGLVLTAGFIAFSFDGLREAMIHGGLGHLEVVSAAAVADGENRLDRSLEHGLADWQALRGELEEQPHVIAVGANVHLMGMATAGAGSVSFVGVGVEPDRERAMDFEVRIREGDDLPLEEPPEGEDVVLLAMGLARSLGVGPGDGVTLLALSPDGMLNALDATAVGLFTTGVQELDTRLLKVHLGTAQRLAQTERVSDILLVLDDTQRTHEVAEALEAWLGGREPALAVVDWESRAPFYRQVRNLYAGIFWFLGAVVFLLVILSVSNTLMMTVLERVQEIGTLRAIGTSRRQVGSIFFLEAIWLGVWGGLLGSALSYLLIHAINALHIKLPPPPGAVSGIDLQLAVVPQAFLGTACLMIVILALAGVLPAARAARMKVSEALVHV